MKGYKGYNKGLVCRGKQYKENAVFEENDAKICESGMHFCELPHRVFRYYNPGNGHEFTEVEALGGVFTDDNEKYCTKKLKVGAKINVFDICKISVSAFFEKFDFAKKIDEASHSAEYNAGDHGAANAGDHGAANAGDYGAANAGDYGAAIVRASSTATVGKNGVAISFGTDSKSRGDIGALLVLVEFDEENQKIICAKSVIVDGKSIKKNTFYTLKNGEVFEAD